MKHVRSYYAKPLLAAGVLSTVLVNHCLYVVKCRCLFVCSGIYSFSEGRKIFIHFFGKQAHSFVALVCVLFVAAANVCLCVLAFYFANCNILYAPLATITKQLLQ